jgi:hypothetical protein
MIAPAAVMIVLFFLMPVVSDRRLLDDEHDDCDGHFRWRYQITPNSLAALKSKCRPSCCS